MNRKDELERAIELAHAEWPDPLACAWCGCSIVVVEYRLGLRDWVPVSCHWAKDGPEGSCPALFVTEITVKARLNLLHAIAPYVFLAEYGERAGIALADPELEAL